MKRHNYTIFKQRNKMNIQQSPPPPPPRMFLLIQLDRMRAVFEA